MSDAPPSLPLPSNAPTPSSGQQLGRYVLGEELGRGGMGVVFRAVDPALKRDVAIKVLADHRFQRPKARARFEREAHAAARLRHPGIVAVHDVGEHEGRPYFVMDLVPGDTLADRLLRGLRRAELLRIVRDVALALAHAHADGLVHRDVKPGNILIDANERALLTDFGLVHDASDGEGSLTEAGEVLGTVSYMAPEQIQAEPGGVGPAADAWALGTILYEGVARRPAFPGGSPIEVMARIIEGIPPPPLREVDPRIARPLADLVERCISPDPARRPSVTAIAGSLDELLGTAAASSTATRAPPFAPPAPPPARTARSALVVGGAGALVIAAFAAGLVASGVGGGPAAASIDAPTPDLITSMRSVTVTGRATGAEVVSVAGRRTPVDRGGRFQAVAALDEGRHTLVVETAVEPREELARVSVTVDLTDPTLELDAPGPMVTSLATLPIAGRLRDAHPAQLSIDGGPPTALAADGRFVVEVALPDAEGEVRLEVVGLDGAGRRASATVVVRVDRTPPGLDLDASPAIVTERSLVLRGRASDASDVTVRAGPTEAVAAAPDGAFELRVPLPDDGPYTLTVTATDAAGLAAAPHEVTVVRDRSAPGVAVLSPESGTPVGPSVVVEGRVVDAHPPDSVTVDGVVARVSDDGSFAATVPIPGAGRHDLTIVAVDGAGLRTEIRHPVLRDTAPPTITLEPIPERLFGIHQHVEVTGRIMGGAATLQADGVSIGLDADGSFRLPIDLVEGTNERRLTARDSVGNEATASVRVEYARRIPAFGRADEHEWHPWRRFELGAAVTIERLTTDGRKSVGTREAVALGRELRIKETERERGAERATESLLTETRPRREHREELVLDGHRWACTVWTTTLRGSDGEEGTQTYWVADELDMILKVRTAFGGLATEVVATTELKIFEGRRGQIVGTRFNGWASKRKGGEPNAIAWWASPDVPGAVVSFVIQSKDGTGATRVIDFSIPDTGK